MSSAYVAISIAIAAAVTLLLRALPFVLFGGNRKTPEIVTYLGKMLPYAVMPMLVVYCLKDTSFALASNWVPRLIASAAVASAYVWKRNSLFSIILGTLVYVVLVQLVF